jgi:hypothetical protein
MQEIVGHFSMDKEANKLRSFYLQTGTDMLLKDLFCFLGLRKMAGQGD